MIVVNLFLIYLHGFVSSILGCVNHYYLHVWLFFNDFDLIYDIFIYIVRMLLTQFYLQINVSINGRSLVFSG